MTITPNALEDLYAKIRARKALRATELEKLQAEVEPAKLPETLKPTEPAKLPEPIDTRIRSLDKYGHEIVLNDKQTEFVNAISRGESVVLIGAAGTGKTTAQRAASENLIQLGKAGVIRDFNHKHLKAGTPGLVITAYTRRAVNNIRKNVPEDLTTNCITNHKFLEFEPVIYSVIDEKTGEEKKKMVFEPSRDKYNPISSSVRCMIYEEASMLGLDLYNMNQDAMPHEHQEIFLGDIQQLPPIFGPAILGFKLQQLRVIELTEVYRQALESPILRLAHRILSGVPIHPEQFEEWHFPEKLKLHPWKKKISPTAATATIAHFFAQAADSGAYNPDEDMILMPFNESFGTIEVNKHIATHLAWKRNALVHEIVAGYNKVYYAEGDKVMYEKNDGVITKIETNSAYSGALYNKPSINLNYWGHRVGTKEEVGYNNTGAIDDVDFILSQVAGDKEDRVRQCSHRITILLSDSEKEVTIDTASAVNGMLHGYALTVHKAQGSEWRKVFLLFHQSHAVMMQRELLYTAVTRAKEELYVICEPETFVKGVESQRIKGNTLEEKAEYFKGKYSDVEVKGQNGSQN